MYLINMTAKTTRRTANTAPPAVPPITAVIGAACSDLVETPAKCISDFLKILFVLFLQFKKNIGCFLICTFNQHLSFIFFLRVSQALLHCSLQRIQGTNIKDCLISNYRCAYICRLCSRPGIPPDTRRLPGYTCCFPHSVRTRTDTDLRRCPMDRLKKKQESNMYLAIQILPGVIYRL